MQYNGKVAGEFVTQIEQLVEAQPVLTWKGNEPECEAALRELAERMIDLAVLSNKHDANMKKLRNFYASAILHILSKQRDKSRHSPTVEDVMDRQLPNVRERMRSIRAKWAS